MTRRDGLSSWRVIFFVTAGMLRGKYGVNNVYFSDGKSQIFYEKPNSFRLGVFFQFQVWNEDSDPPSLTSRERASKNLERAQLSPLEVVVRENHEICRKLAFSLELWLPNQQIRFADANRPPQVTRRNGLPLSSKSNTIAQRAKLKTRQP